MATYKSIVTVTWQFESDEPFDKSLEYAKQQIETILEHPHGGDFEGFFVQLDLAKMKDRKKLIHLATFKLDDVLPYITLEDSRREYLVGDAVYQVRMNSDRYFVFHRSRFCVACGIEGVHMALDMNPGDQSPHFNLYAEESGRMVLMTKDHILAKSRGGKDELENYQVMCSTCNNLKGHYDLNPEQVRELRCIYNNEQKLPRTDLRRLIEETRKRMVESNKNEVEKTIIRTPE